LEQNAKKARRGVVNYDALKKYEPTLETQRKCTLCGEHISDGKSQKILS